MISIQTPIDRVPKIHRKIIPALRRLGIKTVRDLLFHFPSRYEDFSNCKKVRDLALDETATVQGVIERVTNHQTARKHMALTEAVIRDETGAIKAVWFNQPFLSRILRSGLSIALSGKVAMGPKGLYLQNPAYEKVPSSPPTPRLRRAGTFQVPSSRPIHTSGLVAVYPETRGLTSRWLRFLIKSCIGFRQELKDSLPPETRSRHDLPYLGDALMNIHFPGTPAAAAAAKQRFAFEKILILQLRALRERTRLKRADAPAVPLNVALLKKFVGSLPFLLTNAQRRSLWEIARDMSRARPMNRLLEGDVGSGKTVVAAGASLLATNAGLRVAFMAPTEILSRQHHETFRRLLTPFTVETGLLTGSTKRPGNVPVLIGTHALIQKGVQFENLGLVIVDEQHRFGVEQRAKLIAGNRKTETEKETVPHFLSMTATPIPRTLALTVYGDLDLSILDERPTSRKEIITKIVEPHERDETYKFIRKEVKEGRQVFLVCPRIEGSLPLGSEPSISFNPQALLRAETKTVKEEYKKLSEHIFPDLRVEMLHGKMKSKEKEAVMEKFRNRMADVLVSTSVIEVGIDIPNATIMMIEGAERFGLSQLYQFRGRVGRGAEQSYCFLLPTAEGIATRRLRAVAEAKNGFELAEKDLKIRGPGEVWGTRQWGVSDDVLQALADSRLVHATGEEVRLLAAASPDLSHYPELRAELLRLEQEVHLE